MNRALISTRVGIARQVERLQALLLERLQLPAALGRLLARCLCTPREKGVRIQRPEGKAGTRRSAAAALGAPPLAALALTPTFQVGRWPVRASFWKSSTSAVVHAVEVVVGGVVLAHVLDAEEVVLTVLAAAPRGPVIASRLAALPLTARMALLAHGLAALAFRTRRGCYRSISKFSFIWREV